MHETRPPEQHEITELLAKWSGGNETVLDELCPLVYEELRRLARSYMKREPKDTLCRPTVVRWLS